MSNGILNRAGNNATVRQTDTQSQSYFSKGKESALNGLKTTGDVIRNISFHLACCATAGAMTTAGLSAGIPLALKLSDYAAQTHFLQDVDVLDAIHSTMIVGAKYGAMAGGVIGIYPSLALAFEPRL